MAGTDLGSRNRQSHLIWIGVGLALAIVLSTWALFRKNQIMTTLKPGETIKVHFSSKIPLVPYFSQAKVNFVPVGVVTGVKAEANGGAVVSLKVKPGTKKKLGSDPSATIRPTTLLGGNYFVDLRPGGDRVKFTGAIPVSRTALPVELDKVALVFQPSAIAGLQSTARDLDSTFKAGTGSALDRLAADAPAVLRPAAGVLTALQGNNPKTDLTELMQGLEATARQLNHNQGQLDDIFTKLNVTTSALGPRAQDLATTLSRLPGTLDSTDAGLRRLDTSLATLRDTADAAGPVVSALDKTLKHADPFLVQARPVVNQLNRVLYDAQPVVEKLVPTAQDYTAVLDSVHGPVLDRLNGPLKTFLLSPYHGTGAYKGTDTKTTLYQEVVYMLATADRVGELTDHNGSTISFEAGPGLDTVSGLPIDLTKLFKMLTGQLPLELGIPNG